ncbi:hypothetical protein F5B20DRAFT_302352 [Whalleya microplaca]|nr:hypothetical protein F5B20DRAFT_302352 [Whalleya microplaca]
MTNLNAWYWHAIERLYSAPSAAPKQRTKPIQVLCLGGPQDWHGVARDSVKSVGLRPHLHGFDILFAHPSYTQAWARLFRKKWYGTSNGDSKVTAADFDEVLGHCMAVCDLPACCFAAELVAAYPDAKIILNTRDEDAWF